MPTRVFAFFQQPARSPRFICHSTRRRSAFHDFAQQTALFTLLAAARDGMPPRVPKMRPLRFTAELLARYRDAAV